MCEGVSVGVKLTFSTDKRHTDLGDSCTPESEKNKKPEGQRLKMHFFFFLQV